ncbi:MAG: hypothetical protein Q4F57_09680 [Weeksellaceae bacterium]|nr:hypothetical protein [Weeksellaceae bacterium]
MAKFFRRLLRALVLFILVLLLLIIGAVIALQTPAVQTYIAQRLINNINKQFGTTVSVGRVDIDFFGDIYLYDVRAKDHHDLEFITIPVVKADVNLWELAQNASDITINSLTLEDPVVKVITYAGESQDNFLKFVNRFVVEKTSETPTEFRLRGNAYLKNASLSITNENLADSEKVWLDARRMYAHIEDIDLEGSTYYANVLQFSMRAKRHGEEYNLHRLRTRFRMTDTGIFLDNLLAQTQSSLLTGHVRMSYDSIEVFNDFSNKVHFDFDLGDNNLFGYKDLRYFAPDFTKDEVFALSGKITGTMNDLRFENFNISNGETFITTEQLNLLDIYRGGYGVFATHISAKTSYDELKRILPEQFAKNITDYIRRFGQMTYRGSLDLNEDLLNANGSFTSAVGNAQLRLRMTDYATDHARYDGVVSTDGFDLRAITGVDELGRVSGNMAFDGRGYDLEALRIGVNGTLNFVEYAGERYENIRADGVLAQQVYTGFLQVRDRRVAATYDGVFDFSSPQLKLDFDSNIEYINLHYFGVMSAPNSRLSAKIQGKGNFSNLNDLQGNFVLRDIRFVSDTMRVNVDEAFLNVFEDDARQKNISLVVPNELNARIIGQFQLEELPDVFLNGLGNFMVQHERKRVSPGQRFTYEIDIQDDLLQRFVQGFKIQPQTILTGFVDNDANLFELDLTSPYIEYNNYSAQEIHVYASTLLDNSFAIKASEATIANILFTEINMNGIKKQDTVVANASFFSGEQREGTFDLNFYQTFDNQNQIKIGFSPSTIQLEEQIFTINPDNDSESNYALVNLDTNRLTVVNLLVSSDEQYLYVNGDYKNENDFELQADFENLLLQKIIPRSILGDMDLRGIANGEIDVIKRGNELRPLANFTIDSIVWNSYDIGNFVTTIEYDVQNNVFDVQGTLDRDQQNTLYVAGSIDNKGESPNVDLVANLDEFNINILSVFMDEVMTDWIGTLSGDVRIRGDVMNPEVQGFITTKDVGMRVVFLGTTYQFPGENDLILNKRPGVSGAIILPDVPFREVNSRTEGVVDGSLIFADLANWFLDLDFVSDRILVMNTTIADNDLFYGRVFAGGQFTIFGPVNDLEISAYDANVLRGSNLSLNIGGTKSVGTAGFIQFYSRDEFGYVIDAEETIERPTGFTINLDLNVDESSTVNLVLDEANNDRIEARGIAENFKIHMNRQGNLSIDGTYVLSGGKYNYREGIIIDKEFEIERGGFVQFTGDPYDARLDIDAVYTRPVNNVGSYLGLSYNEVTNVNLVIAITGTMTDMEINFEVEIPEGTSQMQSALNARFANNFDEKIRQVGSILVLGRFDSNELLSAGAATDAATASAFELLSKQVSTILSSLFPGLEINATYLQAQERTGQSDRIQADFHQTINNRLRINGAVGQPLNAQTNEQVTIRAEIEYDISRNANGGLLLRAFSRPTTLGIENYTINATFAQNYGAGVVYRRSFNNFRNIFRGSGSSRTGTSEVMPGEVPLRPVAPDDPVQDTIPKQAPVAEDTITIRNRNAFIQFQR